MPEAKVQAALAAWGLRDCPVTLIAARENQVYRVETPGGPLVLRLHRKGYRSREELTSELDWMAELSRNGVHVPKPLSTLAGDRCVEVAGQLVDTLTFLEGRPLMAGGQWHPDADPVQVAGQIGQAVAKLHHLSDHWHLPAGFTRPSWDTAGLIGETPLWDRFWENPVLTPGQAKLFRTFRERAANDLAAPGSDLDYGLIHADAVPENVMLFGNEVFLIDFDDGGFGFRLFDLATTANRLDRHDASGQASAQFLQAYQQARPLDLTALPLFRALRAMTYVGWVITRLHEPGATARCTRFIAEAEAHALAYFGHTQGLAR
jgi:Ser/Thr protein kinase RdoA (MazF antagonist)